LTSPALPVPWTSLDKITFMAGLLRGLVTARSV
jgi:hypothetical protein